MGAPPDESVISFFNKLKKKKPGNLDKKIQELHDAEFATRDCLQCANCCKTSSPIFYQKDIERIARSFKMTPSGFIEKYLKIDSDNDFVFKSPAPCPFLDNDNYCTVYDARPTACREYPHTNRKRFYQILDLTLKNFEICPAVSNIIEKLKKADLR